MKLSIRDRIIKRLFRHDAHSKTSYSQCGEDLIVKFIFDTIGVHNPSYLDVGAHHPQYLSNTALFYDSGCTGINIEPDPALFKEFETQRTRDTNINAGISDAEGMLDFYIMNVPTLNTFSETEAKNYLTNANYRISKVDKIKVLPLNQIIEKYNGGRFPDFLTIDAEGVDELIIKSIQFTAQMPIVICIETMSFSETGRGTKNQSLIDLIISKGYILYADTYLNSIFVLRDKWLKN